MTKIGRFLLPCLMILGYAVAAFAGADDDAAACGVMGCGLVVWLVMMVVMLGIGVTVIVLIFKFIKRDAISRGMPNANSIPWLALLGLVGLVIYLLTRPQGDVLPCPHCNQGRMQGLQFCPHCGQP